MMNSGWQLKRISGPAAEPVTLLEARVAAKIDPDITDEDDLLSEWIQTARELAEAHTKRTFCESTWLLTLGDFPRGDWAGENQIRLPNGPVLAIVSVSYLAIDGITRTVLGPGEYQFGLDDEPPWIGPPAQSCWPNGRCQQGAIAIEYRAGYPSAGSPADAANVPKAVKTTIKACITRWFENRQVVDVEDLLSAGLQHLRTYP